jgi:hypothetical protein
MAKSLNRGMARFVQRRGNHCVVVLCATSLLVFRSYIFSNRSSEKPVCSAPKELSASVRWAIKGLAGLGSPLVGPSLYKERGCVRVRQARRDHPLARPWVNSPMAGTPASLPCKSTSVSSLPLNPRQSITIWYQTPCSIHGHLRHRAIKLLLAGVHHYHDHRGNLACTAANTLRSMRRDEGYSRPDASTG